ncbi:glycosyltransferase family 2 protein [Pelagibacteraceae bacterium]|nr:glycosyltransferase family 2 protein [Pelagibacteraceae bacterium]
MILTNVLTIIIPVYNEKKTIQKIIDKVLKIKNLKKQIIIVDDGSTDGTTEVLKKIQKQKIYKIIYSKKNKGKGYAIRLAQPHVQGEFVIIQDADLEYNPNDIKKIIKVFKNKNNMVVYGSRVLNTNRYKKNNFISIIRVFANHMLTIVSNIINNQNLTDAHTCYKAFNSKIFKKIKLKENSFSFCPEITTKISKLNIPITEIKISYKGRSVKDGKKISLKDAFIAIKTLIKYRFY